MNTTASKASGSLKEIERRPHRALKKDSIEMFPISETRNMAVNFQGCMAMICEHAATQIEIVF